MTDCCDPKPPSAAKKLACPVCQQLANTLPSSTVALHIKRPWANALGNQNIYFCGSSHCDTVYFGDEGLSIRQNEMRTEVGIKASNDASATVCYCFGVSFSAAKENPDLRKFVVEQTRKKVCACAVVNPAGRCCLKDFPKV